MPRRVRRKYSPETIVRRQSTMYGVDNYLPVDLVTVLAFLAARHDRYPFADHVDDTFSLAEGILACKRTRGPEPFGLRLCREGMAPARWLFF